MTATESVRISEDVLQAIREIAEKEDRPIRAQVDRALREWLAAFKAAMPLLPKGRASEIKFSGWDKTFKKSKGAKP